MTGPESRIARPDRIATNESLRDERESTDEAIAQVRSDLEIQADEIVERARGEADAVLDSARDRANLELDDALSGVQTLAAVARERSRADEILLAERELADDTLRRERDEQTRTLSSLLPLERERTDRFLLTERARSDDRLGNRDDFLGMVSHDLRNLLTGVVLEATLLAEGAGDSDEGRRTVAAVDRLQRYAARMNRLVGDLVDVVSIDAGKLTVHRRPHDAKALLEEAMEAFAPRAGESGIALQLGAVESGLVASFDHDRLLQVLANLIGNALKFTPRGGKVVLEGERSPDGIRLSVSDSGSGIAADKLEAVFERFWQAGKLDSRGLGLGLHISKCIVEAHGGRIWAESALGRGSSLNFTIPAD
jgi:signal transduction histidine kinase